jgi:poly-gamma-glutamate synthesis protein (capsule biosynthesis protein)
MKIALLGDIAFFGRYSLQNNVDLYEYFKDVKQILELADIVVGNLESPFVTSQKKYGAKSAHICSSIKNVELLNFLNISIVNLANNHSFDYGRKSFDLTKEILETNNIDYFGVEGKQTKIEVSENKIALSGFCCYSTNPLGIRENIINELNIPAIRETMRLNSQNGYYNILSIHTGEEHVNYPNYNNIKMARILSEEFPYVYYGHHPHVIQGIEDINNSLLLYSLGNFCFDDVYSSNSSTPLIKQSENNKRGLIVILDFNKNNLSKYEFYPIYMDKDKMIVNEIHSFPQLKDYSSILSLPEDKYSKIRESILTAYITDRKKQRNLKWYLKRMNFNSFKMIVNSYKNSKKYHDTLIKYL